MQNLNNNMANCADCEMSFSNISNLRAHIKRKHPGRIDCLAPKVRKSSTLCPNKHVCNECSKTFVSFGNLRFHVRQKHSDKLEKLAPVKVANNYKCSECNAEFHMLQHLIQHKRSHNAKVTILCPLCQYKGASTDTLIRHYKEEHSLDVSIETLDFESFKAFEHWKSTLEKESAASFIKIRGSTKNAYHTKVDYKCHRSGVYKVTGQNIRHLKTQGSNKIGGFCPAKISVIIKNNKCVVKFCGTHVGHQQQKDLHRLFLSKTEREKIRAKIAAKIPLQVILDDIRDSVSNCHLERLHLLTRKDLYNIKGSIDLNGSSDVGNNEEVALVKSLPTDRPCVQSDLEEHILLQKQEILERFKEELDAVKSQDEIDVFKRIVGALKSSLTAVRNQRESTLIPVPSSRISSSKNLEPQR